MNWYKSSKFWPGKYENNSRLIIDGCAHLYIKDEYRIGEYIKEDEEDELVIAVNFYCLIEEIGFPDGDFNDDIELSSAIFYRIEDFCCDDEDHEKTHKEYFRKIGLYPRYIKNFVKKDSLYACWDGIDRWAFIEDKEEK